MAKCKASMRKLILAILFVLLVSDAWSQQQSIYTMQEYTRIGDNPAYTGNESLYDLVLLTRQQWTGFLGAPKSYYLAAHAPLRSQNMGIGFDFQRNTSGPQVSNGIFLSYAYTIQLAKSATLSFGLRAGFNSYQIIYSDLLILDPGDRLFETDVRGLILPNVGTGMHLTYANYYVDFSIPGLLRNEFSPGKTDKEERDNREVRRYDIQLGANYPLADGIAIQPALAVWLVSGAPALIDIRISALVKDAAGIGMVYRLTGSFGAYLTFKVLDNFILGYAYELPMSNNYQLSSGTHEVVLGFDFQFLNRKTLSPRKF